MDQPLWNKSVGGFFLEEGSEVYWGQQALLVLM